jgi:hypothetical protein
MPGRLVGEFGLGRKMRQGNRQPFFDPYNRPLDAGELYFEAIDAGLAHEPSTAQQLHKSSAGTKQSGHCRHRDNDNLPAIAIAILRFGSELALLGHIFGGLGNRAVYPRIRSRRSSGVLSAIVVIQAVRNRSATCTIGFLAICAQFRVLSIASWNAARRAEDGRLPLTNSVRHPSPAMMINLNGSGETAFTTFVKLAIANDRRPLLPRIPAPKAIVAKLTPPRALAVAPLLAEGSDHRQRRKSKR